MKAIMISIKPKYVADILNGKKTLEIRKTIPKCKLPIDVYIYCTKNEEIFKKANGQYYSYKNRSRCVYKGRLSNGLVVAKFTLNKVEEIRPFFHWCEELQKATCLTCDEVLDYLDSKDKSASNPKRQDKVYAWHIDNLKIFIPKPKELSEFKVRKYECNMPRYKVYTEYPLTRAPQSYMFIEIEQKHHKGI